MNDEKEKKALLAAVAAFGTARAGQRLARAVDEEYQRPTGQVDTEYINACEDLLGAMACGAAVEDDRQPQRCQALLNKARAQEKAARRHRRAWGGLAAAALLVGLVASDSLLHWSGLVGRSVNQQQQYNVGGVERDPALIAASSAGGSLPAMRLSTPSAEAAEQMMGFQPTLPQSLPKGWEPLQYTVERANASLSLTVEYGLGEQRLLYTVKGYDDTREEAAQNAWLAALGEENQAAAEAMEAYLPGENGGQAYLWRSGYAVYRLEGPLTRQELEAAAASVTPGQEASGWLGGTSLNTEKQEDAFSALGFAPPMPTYFPEGVSLYGYHVFGVDSSRSFIASYNTPGTDEVLHYHVTLYASPEDADYGGGYEQNCQGRTVTEQGVAYYIAYNGMRPLVSWTQGLTHYALSGMEEEEELLRMAVSASGGDPMQVPLHTVKHPTRLVSDAQAVQAAKEALESRYGVTLDGAYQADCFLMRLSETRSDILVEFRADPEEMWNYAARINAQTGELVAAIDEESWEPYSGALLQPAGEAGNSAS